MGCMQALPPKGCVSVMRGCLKQKSSSWVNVTPNSHIKKAPLEILVHELVLRSFDYPYLQNNRRHMAIEISSMVNHKVPQKNV